MASNDTQLNSAAPQGAAQFFMLPQFILSVIERVLNQVLILDPHLANHLDELKNKRLQIEIRDWQQHIQLVFSGQHFHLYPALQDEQSDCMISADINTLIALKNPAMLTQFIRQDKLDLQGDLQVAQGFSQAFSRIDIDWPERLSRYIGDAPAQQLYLHIKSIERNASQATKQLRAVLTSLCQDELAVTIHPLELAQFKQHTREIKSHVAALEQRINALSRSLS